MSTLGVHGSGHTVTFDGKEYTFVQWTQSVMEAFEEWLVSRLRREARNTASEFRAEARKLFREATKLRDKGLEQGMNMSEEDKGALSAEWEELSGEAQSLEFEAREMVNKVNEQKSAGYYHFFGSLCREARTQFSGRVKLAHLTLQYKHPDITVAEVEKLARKHWRGLDEAMTEAQNEEKKSTGGPSEDSTPPSTSTTKTTTTSEKASGSEES